MANRFKKKNFSARGEYVQDAANWQEMHTESMVRTDIGRIAGLTDAGRRFLAGTEAFCHAERKILHGLDTGRLVNKKTFCQEQGMPGRMFNTAEMLADARRRSAIECHALNLAQKKTALDAAYGKYANLVYGQGMATLGPGLLRRMKRLRIEIARLSKNPPAIHYGGDIYRKQHKLLPAKFRKLYDRARNSHIGCIGSADEAAGNSTLQITNLGTDGKDTLFAVFHQGEKLWHFKLREAGILAGLVLANSVPFKHINVQIEVKDKKTGKMVKKMTKRKITLGHTALTVIAHRGNKNGWRVHVSYSVPATPLTYVPETSLGIDTNTDSLAFTVIKIAADDHLIKKYGALWFPREASSGYRTNLLYKYINEIVALAVLHKSVIVLENLDFEGAKRMTGKLGALLHGMPYAQILKIFSRKCLEHGVPLRLIYPAYTSVLGGYFAAQDTRLSRDVAASLVIALLGSDAGYNLLSSAAAAALKQDRIRLRCNAKKQFGHTTTLDLSLARSIDSASARPRAPLNKGRDIWVLARLIQETLRTVKNVFYSSSKKGIPRLLPCCYGISLSPAQVRANPVHRAT